MTVIDTSAWIEWLTRSSAGQTVAQHLPERQARLVPTMVQLELARWLVRERRDRTADEVIGLTHLCTIVPLSTKIALAAAEACRDHSLATADAIIFATARAYDADLLTCDRDFEGLPGVVLVPKS
jgi:predicted nucleic acid-binding protein